MTMVNLLLIALFACGGADAPAPTTPDAPPAAAQAPDPVQQAATIADAIAKDPGRTAEILKENGTSQAEFEALLYTIAADPTQSRAFAAARAG